MYIIGKRVKATGFPTDDARTVLLSAQPARQPTIHAANKEAERLAREFPGWEFLIFKLVVGIETALPPVTKKDYS